MHSSGDNFIEKYTDFYVDVKVFAGFQKLLPKMEDKVPHADVLVVSGEW